MNAVPLCEMAQALDQAGYTHNHMCQWGTDYPVLGSPVDKYHWLTGGSLHKDDNLLKIYLR